METAQAQISFKNLYGEIFSLTPSAPITMFEIDIEQVAFDRGISIKNSEKIFRFHNNIAQVRNNIIWKGNTYYAAAIKAEGFETNGRGTLPTPRMTMAVREEDAGLLTHFKSRVDELGGLVGAKVTRIRTLAKYLDRENFVNNINNDADPNAEWPRDIYFIDRKSLENKSTIQYELASILDIEGIKLPFRMVVATRCVATYRGEGCLYETVHNDALGINPRLPTQAPPVANDKNETIASLLGGGVTLIAKGEWSSRQSYNIGNYVWIQKDGIKYYFVAKTIMSRDNPIPPPNGNYWIMDMCAKDIQGCNLRWGENAPGRENGNPFNGCLPFVGFPATNKMR
jgi:lambda family phage minor tail protein L